MNFCTTALSSVQLRRHAQARLSRLGSRQQFSGTSTGLFVGKSTLEPRTIMQGDDVEARAFHAGTVDTALRIYIRPP